jgi:hypothetical protein
LSGGSSPEVDNRVINDEDLWSPIQVTQEDQYPAQKWASTKQDIVQVEDSGFNTQCSVLNISRGEKTLVPELFYQW